MSLRIQTLIVAALVAIVFSAGWMVNGWRIGKEMTQLELSIKQERSDSDQRAYAIGQAINTNYQGALNDAIKKQVILANSAAAATRNVGRLREKLDQTELRIQTASERAIREYATTANKLLGVCSQRYAALASRADGHALDARVCRAAWPVN